MSVSISTKTDTTGTYTPAALSTVYTPYSVSAQAADFIVEGYIDLRNMASGDTVIITEQVNVIGNALGAFEQTTYTGAQTLPVVRFFSKTIEKSGAWAFTIEQTAGTLRAFDYAFILQVFNA